MNQYWGSTSKLVYCVIVGSYICQWTTLYILSLLKSFLHETHHWLNNILKRKKIIHIKNRPCSRVVDWSRIHNCENGCHEYQGNLDKSLQKGTDVFKRWFGSPGFFQEALVVALTFAFWDTLRSQWQDCLTESSQHSFADFLIFSPSD